MPTMAAPAILPPSSQANSLQFTVACRHNPKTRRRVPHRGKHMTEGTTGRILTDRDAVVDALRQARRIAVLGIKPESQGGAPAHYVPAYLQRVGYEIVPVPVYFPDVDRMLGEPVYRTVAAIPGDIDMVVVFRRSADVVQHVDDIIAKRPGVVWMQQGIRNDEAAARLTAAGIDVVQNRCTMVEHRLV
jgi:uncharacterized protein